MDIAQFRLDFPEFSDTALYTNSMITFWSNKGEALNSETVFGSCWVNAVELYTAHYITIQKQNIGDASFGGTPGLAGGSVSSKEVGTVQKSFDTNSSAMAGAGQFNETWYGRAYVELRVLFGQGCIQL